ncbi:hypothetical protein [Rosistilla oblonga]|uniref:Uncharacterized protein n=1 Tax=Rosistilla oblonga TaxID=2527990 RepID=A0A518IQW2_9BACT|nr:hypothetical protein [Rosistilla oblonga]QDV55474.1 hypothetical protein Mal33_14480 [Rosistilla oblonga]
MTRKRKPRRRMVYSTTAGFYDGSVIACGPERKPSAKRMKEDGIFIDDDGVFKESHYSASYWKTWDVEQRVKAVTILANRLNTRRAIRELVLPEIAAIAATLDRIERRLDAIERSVDGGKSSQGAAE